MEPTAGRAVTDQQIAEAITAEHESLSLECRADPARFERLLAPDFHEFGASGGEIGYAGTAAQVAAATDPEGEPIRVEDMRGWRGRCALAESVGPYVVSPKPRVSRREEQP